MRSTAHIFDEGMGAAKSGQLVASPHRSGCEARTINEEINEKRRVVQDRLDELGEGVPLEPGERVQVMWTLVTDYCEMLPGKHSRLPSTWNLSEGAWKINCLLGSVLVGVRVAGFVANSQ